MLPDLGIYLQKSSGDQWIIFSLGAIQNSVSIFRGRVSRPHLRKNVSSGPPPCLAPSRVRL